MLRVEQYHRTISTGILEEGAPIELLNGSLARKDRSAAGEDPITVSPIHALIVTLLGERAPDFTRQGCHIRIQQPISLPPLDKPEPDAAIIRGQARNFSDHLPAAGDILAVIEVADSSLRADRTTKLAIYARAAVPLYIIINIPERLFEFHSRPLPKSGCYGAAETFTAKQTILLPTAGKPQKTPAHRLRP